jgi:hypothetical protein
MVYDISKMDRTLRAVIKHEASYKSLSKVGKVNFGKIENIFKHLLPMDDEDVKIVQEIIEGIALVHFNRWVREARVAVIFSELGSES